MAGEESVCKEKKFRTEQAVHKERKGGEEERKYELGVKI